MSLSAWLVRKPKVFPAYYTPADPKWPDAYWFGDWNVLMDLMGVSDLLDNDIPQPELPDWPPEGLSADAVEALGSDFGEVFDPRERRSRMSRLSAGERALVKEYLARTDAALGSLSEKTSDCDPPGCRKVPYYKFMTNDWWLVTPEECRSIARVLSSLLETDEDIAEDAYRDHGWDVEEGMTCFRRWVAYNRLAARCGGYRVV